METDLAMSRRAQTFRQGDVVKALKAATIAGLSVRRTVFEADGKFVIEYGEPEAAAPQNGDVNEWDSVE